LATGFCGEPGPFTDTKKSFPIARLATSIDKSHEPIKVGAINQRIKVIVIHESTQES